MATSAIKLPPGFEVEDTPSVSLPPGFEIEEPAPWKQNISTMARPVLEIGGSIIGGTLGAGATAATVAGVPVGAAVGGALGMAGGKAAADALDTKLGLKNDISPREIIPETAKDIQYGSMGEAVGLGTGTLAKQIAPLGLKAINAVSPSSVKMPAILERFINKEGVATAMDREQLSNVAVSYHKRLAEQISALDQKASETLKSEMDIPKEKIIQFLEQAKNKFVGPSRKAVAPEAETAIRTIDNAINKIKEINPLPGQPATTQLVVGPDKILKEVTSPAVQGGTTQNISQQQLKDIVRQYDNINWADPSRDAKKSVRNVLDMILKSSNDEYAKAMKPVADNIKLEKVIERKFGLKYDPTNGTYATDATAGKWTPKLLEGQKPESAIALKKLDKAVNGDLTEKVRLSNIKDQFTGDKTTGSRMVMLGRSIGSVLGPAGSTIGAMAGAMMDKAGGKVTAGMVDALRSATQNIGAPLNEKTINLLFKTIYTMSFKDDNNNRN